VTRIVSYERKLAGAGPPLRHVHFLRWVYFSPLSAAAQKTFPIVLKGFEVTLRRHKKFHIRLNWPNSTTYSS
jgi:hypothetical protein